MLGQLLLVFFYQEKHSSLKKDFWCLHAKNSISFHNKLEPRLPVFFWFSCPRAVQGTITGLVPYFNKIQTWLSWWRSFVVCLRKECPNNELCKLFAVVNFSFKCKRCPSDFRGLAKIVCSQHRAKICQVIRKCVILSHVLMMRFIQSTFGVLCLCFVSV